MPGLGTPSLKKLYKRTDPARQLNNLLKTGSPVLERARTIGLQTANRLGQFNSSMAVGHATDAILDKASDIAKARAENATTILGKRLDIRSTSQENRKLRKFNRGENRKDRRFDRTEHQKDRQFDRTQRQKDRDLQTTIAQWNLDSADRGQVSSLVTQYMSVYETALANINANKNLNKDDRAAQVKNLRIARSNFLDFLGDTYNVAIEWPTAR